MNGINLPDGWYITTLENIATWGSGGTPSRKELAYYTGNIPWIKTGDLGPRELYNSSEFISELAVQNSSAKYFPKGSVAIAMYGATIGKTSILGIDATTNQACGVGNPIEGVTFSEFLYYFLLNEKDNFIAKGKGGAQPNISQALIKQHECALPPVAEQKVIADKLDTLLAQVETTKARLDRIPQILKTFRQSVLAAAVSGKLTEEWREKNDCCENTLEQIQKAKKSWTDKNANHNEAARVLKRIKAFNATLNNSPTLPNGWVWGNLEDCVLMIVDCHNKTAPYVEDGIPLIRTSNVRDGQFVWEKLRYVNQETYDFWSKRCPPLSGDIIFTREAPMGEAAIIPKNLRVGLGQRTMLIRPVEKYAPAQYLLLAIMDPQFKKRSEVIAVGTGVKHYRVGDVSNLLIPLPSTEEQNEIVRRVEQLFAHADKIEQQVQAAQQRVDKLTQSILAKAFRGELTAQWRKDNPELISGDNSAEALLAKIKAEREAKTPKKKRKNIKAKA
jgi:type I restriction enzyme S subunit